LIYTRFFRTNSSSVELIEDDKMNIEVRIRSIGQARLAQVRGSCWTDRGFSTGISPKSDASSERGFTLTELLIAMAVFTIIMGSVVTLVTKSQSIFTTQQGVSDMDQNARLMIDFLTRDIQEAKENAIGLGDSFRPIYSYNGPQGTTDEITILSSETESKVPAAALPLVPASHADFSASNSYVEVMPNPSGHMSPTAVVGTLSAADEMIISSVRPDGSVQFDTIKVTGAQLTKTGTIGLSIEQVQHNGVQSEVPFGSVYKDGAFSMRPVEVKRYYVDRSTDKEHPTFSISSNDGPPIPLGRNIVAFQVRYLQLKEGDVEGQWVSQQNLSHLYTTEAVEVTLTARTEIAGKGESQRLVTLASVIKPRFQPGSGDQFGSGLPTGGSPATPIASGPGSGGSGSGPGGPGGSGGPGDSSGGAAGGGSGNGNGSGMGAGTVNRQTKYVGDPNSVKLHPSDPDQDQ
jgi:prepilin-type N-terminal cleavage/methylation domain-containing protein